MKPHYTIVPVLAFWISATAGAADAPSARTLPNPVVAEKSLTVKLKDLDLSTEAGVTVATGRLHEAAVRACNYTTDLGDYVVGRMEIHRACVKKTMAKATTALDQLHYAARTRGAAQLASSKSR